MRSCIVIIYRENAYLITRRGVLYPRQITRKLKWKIVDAPTRRRCLFVVRPSSSNSGAFSSNDTLVPRLGLGKKREGGRGREREEVRSREGRREKCSTIEKCYLHVFALSCQHSDANILIKIHSPVTFSFFPFFFISRASLFRATFYIEINFYGNWYGYIFFLGRAVNSMCYYYCCY